MKYFGLGGKDWEIWVTTFRFNAIEVMVFPTRKPSATASLRRRMFRPMTKTRSRACLQRIDVMTFMLKGFHGKSMRVYKAVETPENWFGKV